MPSGVTTIAKRYQVRGIIRAASGTRDQMVDVRLTPTAGIAAVPAMPVIPRKNYGSNFTPFLDM